MKIVVAFVDHDTRAFSRFVGRFGDGRVVFEIGDLLGMAGAGESSHEVDCEKGSMTHGLSFLACVGPI